VRIVKAWLPIALAISAMSGLVYVTGQQILRQGANDPQIQLAEDWAQDIQGGVQPPQLNLGNTIDPTKSVAPFGIVYDAKGVLATGSVKEPNAMSLPDGVIASVDKSSNTESRFTWQPASGARFAVVIKRAQRDGAEPYYVLAGRNMVEVEKRESHVLLMTTFAWLVAMAGSFYLEYIALRR